MNLLAARGLLDVDPYGDGYRTWVRRAGHLYRHRARPRARVHAGAPTDPVRHAPGAAPSAASATDPRLDAAAITALELAATALARTADTDGEAAVRLRLGELLRRGDRAAAGLGQASAALALARAAGNAPVTGRALTLVSRCLLDLGETAAALTVAEQACRGPRRPMGPTPGRRSWSTGRRPPGPVGTRRRAPRCGPRPTGSQRAGACRAPSGPGAGFLGLHLARGDRDRAVSAYRRALSLLPDHPEAAALQRLLRQGGGRAPHRRRSRPSPPCPTAPTP